MKKSPANIVASRFKEGFKGPNGEWQKSAGASKWRKDHLDKAVNIASKQGGGKGSIHQPLAPDTV